MLVFGNPKSVPDGEMLGSRKLSRDLKTGASRKKCWDVRTAVDGSSRVTHDGGGNVGNLAIIDGKQITRCVFGSVPGIHGTPPPMVGPDEKLGLGWTHLNVHRTRS